MSRCHTLLRGPAAAVAALAVAALLTACQTPLDRAFSKSQRAHAARMVANPDAGLDDLEARRPDGISTEAALTKYREAEQVRELDESPDSIIQIDAGN